MATTLPSMSHPASDRAGTRQLPWRPSWVTLALLAIVLLAAALRCANIGAIGQSNTYYTAAVESMLQSWHNFFFVAAEPGGSVSIDKPPVGLWLQAGSAYLFGVNGFAVVLPNILAGIASVALLFHLVRRWFGNIAGLLAALALAVTPVAIAVERNNTPDAALIFTLLLAAWAFIKATETRKLGFLLLGAALVGIGFNIKMMQAFLPLPAFYALYLFGADQPWRRTIVNLLLATLVLIPVSLSWATIVDLTPASQRPYVGSSANNSVYNLIFGYNGLERLEGRGGNAGNLRTARPQDANNQAPANLPAIPNGAAPNQGNPAADAGASGAPAGGFGGARGGMGNGGAGTFSTGERGMLRLFQAGLAAQVSWLLPFGLLTILALGGSVIKQRRLTSSYARGLLLWGGWLLTCVVFFSVAGFFHQYYLAMLGAPLAALVAIGVAFLWHLRAEHPVRAALLLVIAAATTLTFQLYAVVELYQSLSWWLALPVALALAGLVTLLLSLRRSESQRLARWSMGLLVAGLLVVPTVWSGLTNAYATQSLPEAYSGRSSRTIMGGGFGQNRADAGRTPSNAAGVAQSVSGGARGVNQHVLNYLQANTQDTKYLMVVPSSRSGAAYVLATGRPVLYAGGFGGSDPVINASALAKLVRANAVRYVLWDGNGGRGGNSGITSYLHSACQLVDNASIGGSAGNGQSTLYQCGG